MSVLRFRREGDWVQGGIVAIHGPTGMMAYTRARGEISLSWLRGANIGSFSLDSQDGARAIAFSPNAKAFVAVTQEGRIELWSVKDAETPRRVCTFEAEPDILSIAVGDNGETVLAATKEEVLVYASAVGEVTQRIKIIQKPVVEMHVHESGFALVQNGHLVERHHIVQPLKLAM